MFTYTLMYRPAGTYTLPKGWELVARPKGYNHGFELRTDLPVSSYQFGIVGYPQPLTDEDIKTYQLLPV